MGALGASNMVLCRVSRILPALFGPALATRASSELYCIVARQTYLVVAIFDTEASLIDPDLPSHFE